MGSESFIVQFLDCLIVIHSEHSSSGSTLACNHKDRLHADTGKGDVAAAQGEGNE
jgi:hypothetical protein